MLKRIFPEVVDNTYRGNPVALYFFFLITTVTIARSCIHIFAADGGAQSIATIPLDSFTQSGGETVVFMFAQWGLAQLMMGFIYLLVAFRYRSLIPLMYIFVFFEWSARMVIATFKTIETAGVAPAAVGQLIFVFIVPILFYLSIKNPKEQEPG